MQVYPVQQRTRNLTQVFLNHPRPADACFFRMIIKAAWTGVHGSNEHETCRISYTLPGPGYHDIAVFQWLAHHLQYTSFKLRQLIQKEDPIVSQRNFPRLGMGTACKLHKKMIALKNFSIISTKVGANVE